MKIEQRWLLILFLASFILRMLFTMSYVGFNTDLCSERFQLSDSSKYQEHALLLLNDHTFGKTAHVPPGYTVFLSVLYLIFGISFGAVQIVQALLAALMCLLVFDIAQRIFDERTARLAGFLSAIYPFFIYWSGMLVSETLFIFFYLLAIDLFLKHIQKGKSLTNILSAVCLAITALIRPVALPSFGFIMIGFFLHTQKHSLKKSLQNALLFSSIFALTLTPWIVRNYLLFKQFIPVTTQTGLMLLNGMNEVIMENPTHVNALTYNNLPLYETELKHLSETALNKKATSMVVGYYQKLLSQSPLLLLKILGHKFLQLWDITPQNKSGTLQAISLLSFGALMPFTVLGMFLGIKNKKPLYLIVAVFLNTCLLGLIFTPTIRYRFPLEPFYVIVASYGLINLYQILKRSIIQRVQGSSNESSLD